MQSARSRDYMYILFPLRETTRHKSPADEEPDTDVGAPIDCPGDVAVLQPNGSTYRPAANDSEGGSRAALGGGVDRLGCRGRGGTGLVVAMPHVIT